MKKLILFSLEYPYPWGEDSFLTQEIEILCLDYQITVIPFKADLSRQPMELPFGVNVDKRFSEIWNQKYLFWSETLCTLVSIHLWKALLVNWSYLSSPFILKAIVGELRTAIRLKRWLKKNYADEINEGNVILYSWWLNWAAIASCIVSKSKDTKVIARAHGQDLYHFRTLIGFHPFQRLILEKSSCVLPDSEAGVNYLKSKYPKFSHKVHLGRLGTRNPGTLAISSADNCIRILSIASLYPVKRIELLAQAFLVLTTKYRQIDFLWKHIGDGPDRPKIMEIIARHDGLAARVNFLGHLQSHFEVMSHFSEEPVDLVINVSSSEGIPVSLMEATSFGVPIMATNVGGNSEIVDDTRGFLLNPDPDPEDIAKSIATFSQLGKRERMESRINAREGWEKNFSAKLNYEEFKKHLDELN